MSFIKNFFLNIVLSYQKRNILSSAHTLLPYNFNISYTFPSLELVSTSTEEIRKKSTHLCRLDPRLVMYRYIAIGINQSWSII